MKKNSTNSESDSQNSEEVHDEKIEDNHLGEESASLPPEDHITEIKPCAVSTMNPLPQKRRTISFWAAMTFGILFVVSVIACIILYYDNFLLQAESANQISVLQEENEKLRSNYEYQLSLRNDTEKENKELKEEISDIRDNIDLLGSRLEEVLPEYYFYHNGAVMITETGSKYHRYGCQYVEGRTYWIYNVELAIYEGYTPCSVCNPPRG